MVRISAAQLPVWIGKEAQGFLPKMADGAGSKETPISQVTGPPIVNAVLRGSDAVFVAGGAVILDYWLMSRPEIKSAEQLKGGSVARFRLSAASRILSRRIVLKKLNLVPGKDVTIVQIGVAADRLNATEREKCAPLC